MIVNTLYNGDDNDNNNNNKYIKVIEGKVIPITDLCGLEGG